MGEPACFGCRNALKRITKLEVPGTEQTRKPAGTAPLRRAPPGLGPLPRHKSGAGHGAHERSVRTEPGAEYRRAPLPARPHGNGPLIETGTAERFHTELPRRPLSRKSATHPGEAEPDRADI